MGTNRNPSTGNANSIELIGLDGGPFDSRPRGSSDNTTRQFAPLVSAQFLGPHIVQVKSARITVDGMDGTQVALRLLRHFPRGTPVLMSGVAYGGFNLIDPRMIHRQQKAPVIVIIGSKPRNRLVKRALVRHFPDWEKRWNILRSLGPLRPTRTFRNEPPIFYESLGCPSREAKTILSRSALISRIPEPVRIAGILARGLFT